MSTAHGWIARPPRVNRTDLLFTLDPRNLAALRISKHRHRYCEITFTLDATLVAIAWRPAVHLAILSSMVPTVLVAATGCGASSAQAHRPARSVQAIEVDTSKWITPGEMSLAMSESSIKRVASVASALPSPNRREATYGLIRPAY